MRAPFMRPSQEEVVALATDLTKRFGRDARNEALRLQDVAVLIRSIRNRNLYRRAAHEIQKRSFEAPVRPKTKPVSQRLVPESSSDAAFFIARSDGRLVDVRALAAEAGRRGLRDGVGALVALRDRFVGFGVDLPRSRADRGA